MSGEPAEDSDAVQGLLGQALDEEEQRLSALEGRVKRLTERRTRGQLRERLAAGDGTRMHTQRLPLDIPPAGTLAEMLEDVEDTTGSSLADLVEEPQAEAKAKEDAEAQEDAGAEEKEDAEARRRAFSSPAPELLDAALAALEAPKPRGFRDEPDTGPGDESDEFRAPLPALPADVFEVPKPRGFTGGGPEEFRETVLAMPPGILDAPRPRGFNEETTTDLEIAGLQVRDAVVDEDAAEDLYRADGERLAIPEDDQSSAEGAPLSMPGAAAIEAPRFAELSVDSVEQNDVDDAETEAARALIEETGRQLRELERQLLERKTAPPPAVVPPPPELPPPPAVPVIEGPQRSASKFGLNRAFGGASGDLSRVLDGQKRLLDQVEALSSEIEDIRANGGPPSDEGEALNTRVEHAEAAAAEAWRHVGEATARTEKLVELVERIVERVGRLEDRPAPPPAVSPPPPTAPPPPPAAPPPPPSASADPGATQQLIRLLQSGQMPRRDFTLSGVIPRLEASGVTSRSRDLLLATVKEHHDLLKDQGRLLERLIKLEERT